MKKGNRLVLRAAQWLHDQFERGASEELATNQASLKESIRSDLDQAIRLEHLLYRARGLGFTDAAERLRYRCMRARDDLAITLDVYVKQARRDVPSTPALGMLVAELCNCEKEFGNLEVSSSERRISVQTERIVLEGTQLGTFRIDLLPTEICTGTLVNWFRVEALEPNPAAADHSVPHPHISHTSLCTGDGTTAARTALVEGRLCDFFILIRSILETYNPESAYAELDNWHGVPCHECEYMTNEDCAFYCEGCEETYCDECIVSCSVCETILCRSCLFRSEPSDTWVCESCSAECESCCRRCERERLVDGLCPDCHELEDEPMEVENETDSSQQTQQETAPSVVQ